MPDHAGDGIDAKVDPLRQLRSHLAKARRKLEKAVRDGEPAVQRRAMAAVRLLSERINDRVEEQRQTTNFGDRP
jgi:hypothetical protein